MAAYEGDNGWNAQVDVSYVASTERNELNLESYSGTGRGFLPTGASCGATDTISFTQTTRTGTRPSSRR